MPLSERTQRQLDTMLARWDERDRHNALDAVEQYVGDLEARHFDCAKRMDEIDECMTDLVGEVQKLQSETTDRLADLLDDLGMMLDGQREDLAKDLAGEREPYTRALGTLERHLFSD